MPIHEELSKHSEIQEQRPSTTDQPAEIHKNIRSVDRCRLSRLTITLSPVSAVVIAAYRIESYDAEDVCQIANTCEEEEQSVQSLS